MGTRSYIALQIEEDEYLTIFCHYNGYPDDICSQTYYKWQKRLFSVGKTAIVNVDPPPSPLQRKQGRPEILLTGPHLFPRIFFPAAAV